MSFPAYASTLVSLLGACYLWYTAQWRARSGHIPLPPGPKPIPVLGNVLNMPRSKQWIGYRDLGNIYGDILYFHILGQSFVILQSAEAMYEYLGKRTSTTSDRLQTPMIELSGSSLNIGFMPYGQWWRRHRRYFWQHFRPDAVVEYMEIQERMAHDFLQKLCDNPTHLRELIQFNLLATILKIVYDINVQNVDDDYIKITREALEGLNEGMVPGRFWVDIFPFLRYIPPWLPGAISQRMWAKWQAAGNRLKNLTYLKADLTNNEGTYSITAKLYKSCADRGILSLEDEDIIKNVAAMAFEGAIDTIMSAMQAVFYAVSLDPEVLKRAHAELDAIVGPDRLPNFNDRNSLTYVDAIIKEALRWHVVAPFGVPHAVTADDTFRGYFIPARTVLIPNIWACMHDPDVYKDPDTFRPERFIRDGKLDTTVQDPTNFVFGFGRRICPGRYFAENALFINVACALHVFDITQPIGGDGQPLKFMPGHTDSLVSHLEDCRCIIKPRSTAAEALIRSQAVTSREASE